MWSRQAKISGFLIFDNKKEITELSTPPEKMLANFLNDRGEAVLLLDGDKIRSTMHKGLDFSSENIKINSHAIINLCKEKESLHDYIVVSVIAPFEETRKYARKILGDNYIEIFVKASFSNINAPKTDSSKSKA